MAKVNKDTAARLESVLHDEWRCEFTNLESIDMMKTYRKIIFDDRLDYMFQLHAVPVITYEGEKIFTTLTIHLEIYSGDFAIDIGVIESVHVSGNEMTLRVRQNATVHMITFQLE